LPKYRHLPESSHRQWHYCGILAVEDFDGECDILTLQQKKSSGGFPFNSTPRPTHGCGRQIPAEGCIHSDGYRDASLRMAPQVSSGIARKIATT
jgi:hypothetical protein